MSGSRRRGGRQGLASKALWCAVRQQMICGAGALRSTFSGLRAAVMFVAPRLSPRPRASLGREKHDRKPAGRTKPGTRKNERRYKEMTAQRC